MEFKRIMPTFFPDGWAASYDVGTAVTQMVISFNNFCFSGIFFYSSSFQIQIKMKWLLCLAILLCLTSFSDACEKELVKNCTKSYVTLLDKKPDEGSHCTRLKVT